MGDIYECEDTHLNRSVILKMLKCGEEGRRLLDEQKALIKLRSKHVVQLYDVVTVELDSKHETALVLEHIDGADLEVESMAPDGMYLKTLWQVACGLTDIHKEGIIHRDIKPNNIRVDADGVIKILDFGLARSAGLEAVTMCVIGTPGYMAPELWGSETVSFDQAIDVYAFGIMALTLVTLRIPKELLDRPPIALPKGEIGNLLVGLPQDVISILELCLSFDPTERPQIEEVEVILRRHLLQDRHRALLVLGTNTHEITAASRSAIIKSGKLNEIRITYDGLRFTVTSCTVNILINNTTFTIGDELPPCCVIAFSNGTSRSFVTFDVSNPEVMS